METIDGIAGSMPFAQQNVGYQKEGLIRSGKYNSEYARVQYIAVVR